jgi:PAS domain S-box-containing protein
MDPEPLTPLGQGPGAGTHQVNDLIEAGPVDLDEFKHFLDHLPVAVIISKMIKAEPRIMYANGAFEKLTGRPLEEIRGKNWSILDLFYHEDDPNVGLGQALLSDDDSVGTFRAEHPRHVLVEAYSGVIQDEDSQEKYRIAALVDVTERARAQREEFARQIRDKDLLLKEIQHRVKNNLQLITALIRLEARSEHSEDKATLDRLAGRIEALQFLYQALSTDRGGDEVDLGQYLSQIAAGVMRAHSVEGIGLDVKVETAPVSINVAMPVGLAVNELLTNAFKYAFRGRDSGVITLKLLREASDRYWPVSHLSPCHPTR